MSPKEAQGLTQLPRLPGETTRIGIPQKALCAGAQEGTLLELYTVIHAVVLSSPLCVWRFIAPCGMLLFSLDHATQMRRGGQDHGSL